MPPQPSSNPSASSSSANVMLAIYEKKTTSLDLYRPLRSYVSTRYSEREAQNLEEDLQVVKNYRSEIERQADPTPSVRKDLFVSYFKALCLIETRFPISPDKDHVNTVSFTWHDAFKQKQKATQQSIYLEKAAILFNLGAVFSQIGLSFDRSSVDGRKQAIHSFISAAGTFGHLKDTVSQKVSSGTSSTVDLSAVCAGMLERLMLAQAQECFFENAVAKSSTPGLCSKIARQVSLYYEECFGALSAAPLKDHFDKGWISHVQLKAALFYAEACYRYCIELHDKEEIAEEIARLKSGSGALTEAKKSVKGASQQLVEAITNLDVNITRNLERAMKENDRVYLMRVPALTSLSPLPSISMVKPVSMVELLDASNEKLFSSLVPDTSAISLSRYSEMVDNIIRTQAERLQQSSELARVKLKEMELPESLLALEGSRILPLEIKEQVEAVQVSGGPSGLETELAQLRDMRRINQELLVSTEDILKNEAGEDGQFRSQFGSKWNRPLSTTLTKGLLERLNKFAANLKQAAESDSRIERAVSENYPLLSVLDKRPIESALPTISKPIMSLDANEDAIVGSLKQSLRQLENMGAHRASLEDMLKDMKRKDNILPKLMTSIGSHEDLFKKEVSKYDTVCDEISKNIQAQEHLLIQIQAQNDQFAAVFNLDDYKVAREKCYKQIQAAVAKYQEIKEILNEGLKFYCTLQDAIGNIKQQCNDFVMTRSIQAREMMEDIMRQNSGTYPSPSPNPGIRPGTLPGSLAPHYYRPQPPPPLPLFGDQAYQGAPYPGTPYPQPSNVGQTYGQQQPSNVGQTYGQQQPPYPGWGHPYPAPPYHPNRQ